MERNFDIAGAEKVLKVTAQPLYDVRDGQGVRFAQHEPPFQVDLYGDIYLARYKDPMLEIAISPVQSLRAQDQWATLEGQVRGHRAALNLNSQGFMALNRLGEAGTPALKPVNADTPKPEQREEELVSVTGNVGKFVDFRVGRESGRARFTFSLFEHFEGKPDQVHKVVSWLEAAHQASQEIDPGDYIKALGKFHTRETQNQQRQPITVEELVMEQWQVLRKSKKNGRQNRLHLDIHK